MIFKQCRPTLFVDHVPFKEYLVYPDPKHMEPPEYLQEIKHPPDWGIIFEKELPSEFVVMKMSLLQITHLRRTSIEYA